MPDVRRASLASRVRIAAVMIVDMLGIRLTAKLRMSISERGGGGVEDDFDK